MGRCRRSTRDSRDYWPRGPVPILQSLLGDDEIAVRYRIGSVTTVVDSVNGPMQLDATFEAPKQLAVADRIVLSKTDIASAEDLACFEKRLAALNPGVAIIRAVKGEMAGGDWASHLERFGDDRVRSKVTIGDNTDFDARVPFRHGDVRTFSLTWPQPVKRAGLHTWLHLLASFRGPDLLDEGHCQRRRRAGFDQCSATFDRRTRRAPARPSSIATRASRLLRAGLTRAYRTDARGAWLSVRGRRAEARSNRYANFVSLVQTFAVLRCHRLLPMCRITRSCEIVDVRCQPCGARSERFGG